jgi:hypothetical protein
MAGRGQAPIRGGRGQVLTEGLAFQQFYDRVGAAL